MLRVTLGQKGRACALVTRKLGLGGVLTLPVAVPSALGASWVIQARMVAAIAGIYGHDIRSDRVRTLVLLALVGDSAKEVVKAAGVKVSEKVTTKLLIAA